MPIYPIVNIKTGEKTELKLSVDEWEQFKKDNTNCIRDWSDPSTCPSGVEMGEWKDTLIKKHSSWNEVLSKVGRVPGSSVKKI